MFLNADQDKDRVVATIEQYVPAEERSETLVKLFKSLSSVKSQQAHLVVALLKHLLLHKSNLFTIDNAMAALKLVMPSFHEKATDEDLMLPGKLAEIIAPLIVDRQFDFGALVRLPEAHDTLDDYYADAAPHLFCSIVRELVSLKNEAGAKEILSKAGLTKSEIIVRDNFEEKCKSKYGVVHALFA